MAANVGINLFIIRRLRRNRKKLASTQHGRPASKKTKEHTQVASNLSATSAHSSGLLSSAAAPIAKPLRTHDPVAVVVADRLSRDDICPPVRPISAVLTNSPAPSRLVLTHAAVVAVRAESVATGAAGTSTHRSSADEPHPALTRSTNTASGACADGEPYVPVTRSGLPRRASTVADRPIRMFAMRTIAFLVAFLVKWLVPTINRLYLLWRPSNFILFSFQAFLISTGSLLNALIYFGFDAFFAYVERGGTSAVTSPGASGNRVPATESPARSKLGSAQDLRERV
ncbi:hypothetical protein HK405_000671 [Cladochytrium tenue]|nr:hypothetical protein HK405_000671 [Cladochytrium tenue]